MIASSSELRVSQTRSALSSVLKESTKLSATALSVGTAAGVDRGHGALLVEELALGVRGVSGELNRLFQSE